MVAGAEVIAGELLAVTTLLGLPGAGGVLLGRRLGVSSRPLLCIFGLAAPCLIGYASVWLYLASPAIGRSSTLALYLVTVAATAWLAWRARPEERQMLRWWGILASGVAAASALVLGMGFLRGGVQGVGGILATAQVRYTGWLPDDAKLPYDFALQLLAGQRPLPHVLVGGWLSSDRPPLQTGVYLLVRSVIPYSDGDALLYQVTGTVLQSLWVPALWCFFSAVRLDRRAVACGTAALATSGFIIVNSFFVWPKLFPAAFLVLIAAVVLTAEWDQLRKRRAAGLGCGLAAGLALLGHDGSAFVLLPLALLLVPLRKRWPGVRSVVPAVVAVMALMLPWFLYQHYYDPPGTKVAKIQLAGQRVVDPHQSLLRAVESAYSKLDARQIAHDKWTNLTTPFSHELADVRALEGLTSHLFAASGTPAAHREAAVTQLRQLSFFEVIPATGFFVLGLPPLVVAGWRRRARDPDVRAAGRVSLLLALTLVVWAVVLFGPNATVTYQGSFAVELLLFAVATIGLWRLSRWLTLVVTALQAVLGLLVYILLPATFAHTVPPGGPIELGEALLACAGLVSVVVLPLLGPVSIGGGAHAVGARPMEANATLEPVDVAAILPTPVEPDPGELVGATRGPDESQ